MSKTNIASKVTGDNRRPYETVMCEGEAAVTRFGKSRDEILPMARGIQAARDLFPANQKFGEWLKYSPYRLLDKNDRAALIQIGALMQDSPKHEAEVVAFLKNTSLVSPRLILEAMQEEASSHDGKTPPPVEEETNEEKVEETKVEEKVPKKLSQAQEIEEEQIRNILEKADFMMDGNEVADDADFDAAAKALSLALMGTANQLAHLPGNVLGELEPAIKTLAAAVTVFNAAIRAKMPVI